MKSPPKKKIIGFRTLKKHCSNLTFHMKKSVCLWEHHPNGLQACKISVCPIWRRLPDAEIESQSMIRRGYNLADYARTRELAATLLAKRRKDQHD